MPTDDTFDREARDDFWRIGARASLGRPASDEERQRFKMAVMSILPDIIANQSPAIKRAFIEQERAFRIQQAEEISCDHGTYVTHGNSGYPYEVDRGPYCPVCDEMVDL